MALAWAVKRRVAVIVFLIVVLGGGGTLYWYVTKPLPSCFDRKQNQDEEGVDCGGKSCVPCAAQIKEPVVLWSRFFPLHEGTVDVAALVQNPNEFLQASGLSYVFKVFDSKNLLIAVREGKTFLEPSARTILFEPDIPIGQRVAAKAFVELGSALWQKKEPAVLQINILKLEPFLQTPFPRLEAQIKNDGTTPYHNIEVTAVLWADDRAVGVSRTILDALGLDQERNLAFTWPDAIAGVTRAELFFRQLP